MSRSAYEIRAVGDVPAELLDDFEGATVSIDPGGFTIHVVLGDDTMPTSFLDGVLGSVRWRS